MPVLDKTSRILMKRGFWFVTAGDNIMLPVVHGWRMHIDILIVKYSALLSSAVQIKLDALDAWLYFSATLQTEQTQRAVSF